MQSLGTFKRGDTFAFAAAITDTSLGTPLTGKASGLRCEGRHYINDALITELTVSESAVPGTYLFTEEDTSLWEDGWRIYFDIEYTGDGIVSSTETFYVDVEADITHE